MPGFLGTGRCWDVCTQGDHSVALQGAHTQMFGSFHCLSTEELQSNLLMRFLFSGDMVNLVVPRSVLLLPAASVFIEPPSVPYAIFVLLFSCLQEGSGYQAG